MNNLAVKLNAAKPAILIAEDHSELRSSLAYWLGSFFSGCTVITAGSGEEAVALASTNHPDIVLMDIRLPQMNGMEAIRQIKKISPQTQAIILSIMSSVVYIAEARAVGACAYIHKQQMHTELIPVLTKLLPATASSGEVP